MHTVKLANVYLDANEQFFSAPGLYCKATAPLMPDSAGAWCLFGPGTFDFTTFFNALPVLKWRIYTETRSFQLHLELEGAPCTIVQTHAEALDKEPQDIPHTSICYNGNGKAVYNLDLVCACNDVLEGFKITTEGPLTLANSYYSTKADDDLVVDVEMAVCITTYRKEAYVMRNLESIRTALLESDDEIATHLTVHVADNGRTLDPNTSPHECIRIHPNPNVGGAGGFARCMLEALEDDPHATVVLLMDDDVTVCPESIFRAYSLYRLANGRYSEAILSGCMMMMNDPALRWEDMGHMAFDGNFVQLKPPAHMDVFHNIVEAETYKIPEAPCDNNDKALQHYAAWWFCAIPVAVIEKQGLPLPFFVRCDDVEFGLRQKHSYMTMNGICTWHEPFYNRYNAAQERYLAIRNMFTMRATSGAAPLSNFLAFFEDMIVRELKSWNYANAELALAGFEDFLKGPELLAQPLGEKQFEWANDHAEKLLPFEELQDDLHALGINLNALTTWDLTTDAPRSRIEALSDFVTFNGQRLPRIPIPHDIAVLDYYNGRYLPGKLHHARVIVAIDPTRKRGVIRSKSHRRFAAIWKRYKKDIAAFKKERVDLEARYLEARPKLTSPGFWKDYLSQANSGE